MLNVLTADESETPQTTKRESEEKRRMRIWLEERIAAGAKKPTSEIVTITPILAELILDRNPVNRPINKRNATDIASDIASGRWQFNGESVVISDNGLLLNGQHRCLEVVATRISIETVLVFGPKEESRFTIDTGRTKSLSNFLSMKGRAYPAVLGTVIGYHLQWRTRGFIVRATAGTYTPTKAEVLSAVDELKGIETSIEVTAAGISALRCHSALAFCHYVFWKKAAREAADHFILRLIEGDGLKKGDPILYCRNRLLNMMGRGTEPNTRLELIFKCWNAHRLGQPIDHFKLAGGKLPKVGR